MNQLDASQINLIGQSSNLAITNSLINLKGSCLGNGLWLGNNNRYCNNTIKNLEDDIKNSRINDTELVEYIAASAPLHCADGWSYLGRALQSHMRSDCDSARHLAYYAELRAAMSLLATQGIGIFNSHHFVVDNQGKCHLINKQKNNSQRYSHIGTHAIAWLALQEWAKRSGDLLADIISIKNIPLRDWLVELGQTGLSSSGNIMPITQDWFKKWGVDLSVLTNDRDERNNASYRPTRLIKSVPLNVLQSSSFVRDLWTLYQPAGSSVFENLDRHLLRLSLELLYQSSGKNISLNPGLYANRIRKVMDSLGITSDSSEGELLTNFLIRRNSPLNPQIIEEASVPVPQPSAGVTLDKSRHHLQVISRATLLLRVASASCSRLMHDASLNACEDLEFWWRNLGEERGLWQTSNEPEENLDELWADIEVALQSVQQWEQSNPNVASYGKWQQDCSQSLFTLGGCELIALWGLGV
jgi:hypothetical protein